MALDAASIDCELAQIIEQLAGSVLAANEVEQGGSVINEGRPAVALDERGMGQERPQEGDVGLDATDPELDLFLKSAESSTSIGKGTYERAEEFTTCDLKG